MRQCPECYRQNPDEAEFCAGCGARLTQLCPRCAHTIAIEARFCPHCGAATHTTPTLAWAERRLSLSPQVRLALAAVARGLGVTMLILAVMTLILTPPPLIFDDVTLLMLGTVSLVLGQLLKPRRKAKPGAGSGQEIEIIPPDEAIEVEMPVDS
jgi:hypothetical protein